MRGLIQQAHVLARHRRALQYTALVGLGWLTWDDVMEEQLRSEETAARRDTLWHQWIFGEIEAQFPGPGTRAIQALGRRLAARGTHLVIVEAPLHPMIPMSLGRKQAKAFRTEMAAFAREEGWSFVGGAAFSALEVDDFIDMIHLNAKGSENYTRDLARAIEPLLHGDA